MKLARILSISILGLLFVSCHMEKPKHHDEKKAAEVLDDNLTPDADYTPHEDR